MSYNHFVELQKKVTVLLNYILKEIPSQKIHCSKFCRQYFVERLL